MFVSKKIPYTLKWDRMPVDISFVFENEKPAGKHGFLTVKNGDFFFEDGTKARFWGTNFNSGANFPSHAHAEIVAKRLAQAGLNMVRLHQLDAEWSCPNIFRFTRGKRIKDTQSFDPESMDRLDYLIYCLKKEGIYVYLDFLTYRRFKTGDGVPLADKLPELAKPYAHYNPRLKELQKQYIRDLVNHINPYTGLAYKDEPAIALADIINESDLWVEPARLEPYKGELLSMLEAYAEEKGEKVVTKDISDLRYIDPLMHRFFCDTTKSYYREIMDYMRKEGLKIPVTGTNWASCQEQVHCNQATDFSDAHVYWWKGDRRSFMNEAHVKNADIKIRAHAMCAVTDNMPFFISEWDAPWPNEYRADTTLWLAAIGAFQGYGGFTIHTYRYGTNEDEAETGKIGRNVIIGNSYYRGIFDTYNDPAKFGLFYHAALITRRGDVREADETVIVGIPEEKVYRGEGGDAQTMIGNMTLEKHRVRVSYEKESEGELVADGNTVLSDTGEIFRDRENGYGYIDSPKTKAVYGFTGNKTIKLTNMEFSVKNDFATVAISSLEDEEIEKSGNLLLTAVGRADNTDAQYNEDHTVLEKDGHAPVLIDVIEAEIRMKTNKEKVLVWSVDSDGFLIGIIPSVIEDGWLKFTIGQEFESMYYLIQEQ